MSLPPIIVSAADRDTLAAAALAALCTERPPVAAALLLRKLGRATIVADGAVPDGVVAVGSEIDIRHNLFNIPSRVTLVRSGEEARDPCNVSVLTPLGAALIGLSEGDSIGWCTPTGDRRTVNVLQVAARADLRG